MSYTGAVKNDNITAVSYIHTGGSDLTSPYLGMKLDTANPNGVIPTNAANDADDLVGFATEQTPVKAGEHIAVKGNGYVLAVAGGNIAIADEIGLTTGGKVITVTTGKSIGIAVSAGANNEYVQIKLYGVVKTLA